MYVTWLHVGLSLSPYVYILLTLQIFPGLNFLPFNIDRNVGSFSSSSNYNSKWEILHRVTFNNFMDDKLLLNFGTKFQDQFLLWDVKLQIAMAMFGMKFIYTINKER